ncbi:retrovirus-related pol polyprotein from transposon TNT 1-94 [Tanacetum coccineum]
MYNGRKGIGFDNPSYFHKAKDLRPSLCDEKAIGLGYTLMFLTHSDEALEVEKFKRAREHEIKFAYDYGSLNAKMIIINLEDEVVNLLEKEKEHLEIIKSLKSKGFESCESEISESKNQNENECLRDLDTYISVRRPKSRSVIWQKKGSSNAPCVDLSSLCNSNVNKDVKRYSRKDLLLCNNQRHVNTKCAYACNDAMNVSCNSRLHASYDMNVVNVLDDVSISNSRVSKRSFRKKHCDSFQRIHVHYRSNSNNPFPSTSFSGRSSNLYTIDLNEIALNSSVCLLAMASFSQSWLWHQCLSHLNFNTINNLVKNNLVRGLPKMKFKKDHLCSACEQGKIHRKHHKSKTAFASNKPLYLLHMDLYGPMHVESINGNRYVLVVLDDYSRYIWVFFLRSKDEASEVIILFIKKTQVILQLQVQHVRTGNGT